MRAFAAALLSLLSQSAFAYLGGEVRSEYVANRSIQAATSISQAWSTSNGAGGAVNVGRDFVMKAPGGRTVTNSATAVLTKAMIAKAALGAIPIIGAAAAAYDLYDMYRVHVAGATYPGTPCAVGEPCFDEGVAPNTGTGVRWGYTGTSWTYLTFQDAMQGRADDYNATGFGDVTTGPSCSRGLREYRPSGVCTGSGSSRSCDMESRLQGSVGVAPNCTLSGSFGAWAYSGTHAVGSQTVATSDCPASIDPFNAAYNVAAGGSPGADGKCPTARGFHEGLTQAEAAAKVAVNTEVDWKAIADEALGVVPIPLLDETAIEVGNAVPFVEGGETVTTTIEDGDTRITTEAVGWDFSRDPLRKNTGTWPVTKTTTVRDGEGNIIKQTTTTEGGKTEEELAEGETANQCKLNPKASGCAELGEAPADEPLDTQTVVLAINLVPGFGPSNSACPAPRTASLAGGLTIAMPFDLFCDFASGIRPVVIAVAWIGGLLTFMGIARRES